jgi:hypothetical protein
MRKIPVILTLLILVFALGARCQYYSSGLSAAINMPKTQYTVDSTGKLRFKPGDMGFSMQVGTGFAGNFKGNSTFGTYVSPSFAYNVSSRFRLKAGVSVLTTFGDPYFAGYDINASPVMKTGTTTSLFVQGDYILSNKFMISGTLYKDVSMLNAHVTDPNYKQPDNQGVILNLNYRPTQHFEINASFGYSQGNRSPLYSPFYDNGLYQPASPW